LVVRELFAEQLAVLLGEKALKWLADDLIHGLAQHLGQLAVTEEDSPVAVESGGTLGHRLDQNPVDLVGTAECVNSLSGSLVDNQGVDLATTDRLQRRLALRQPRAEFGDSCGQTRNMSFPWSHVNLREQ
jgi:hypothetical protein